MKKIIFCTVACMVLCAGGAVVAYATQSSNDKDVKTETFVAETQSNPILTVDSNEVSVLRDEIECDVSCNYDDVTLKSSANSVQESVPTETERTTTDNGVVETPDVGSETPPPDVGYVAVEKIDGTVRYFALDDAEYLDGSCTSSDYSHELVLDDGIIRW